MLTESDLQVERKVLSALHRYVGEMGTIVLLAAFLLSASATPLENSLHDYIEDAPVINTGEGSDTHVDGDSTTTTDIRTEDNSENHSQESDPTIDLSQNSHEHNPDNNDEHAPTSSVSTGSTTATKPSPADNSTNNTDVITSSVATGSTVSTILEDSTPESNTSLTTPADADPVDCRNATEPDHIYLQCSYGCGGDEMLVALNNSKCFLNQTQTTLEFPGVRSRTGITEIGICIDGECVQSPPETSTSTSTTETPTSTSTTAPPTNISLSGNETHENELVD